MDRDITEEIIADARALCQKFVAKVETGRARSIETYHECENLLEKINQRGGENADKSGG